MTAKWPASQVQARTLLRLAHGFRLARDFPVNAYALAVPCVIDAETDDRVDRIGCKSRNSLHGRGSNPAGKQVAGLLEVFSAQPYAFNADDIGALQQLTGSIQPAEVRGGEAPSFAPPPKVTARTPPPRAAAKKEITPALSVPVHAQERTPVPATSRHRPLHKILLVAAIGTFVFAVLWLIAPWVSTTFGSAGRSAARAQAPQNPARQSASPAGVSDLAGLRKVARRATPRRSSNLERTMRPGKK